VAVLGCVDEAAAQRYEGKQHVVVWVLDVHMSWRLLVCDVLLRLEVTTTVGGLYVFHQLTCPCLLSCGHSLCVGGGCAHMHAHHAEPRSVHRQFAPHIGRVQCIEQRTYARQPL
jgi:hypothetical protein